MGISFEISEVFPAPPEQVYNAWLDSKAHAKMTGGAAMVSDVVGEAFTAWDGYIRGTNLELEAPVRILQDWRTSEFTDDEGDSRLEVLFEEEGGGTRVTIRHSNLPEHGMQYKQGWVDSYFTPMKSFFK